MEASHGCRSRGNQEEQNLPLGANKIGVKWIYQTKFNELGDMDKHKAQLVAKGYSQQHCVDFTTVARMETVKHSNGSSKRMANIPN